MACGIFLDQGLNPCRLHWQTDSLPLSPQKAHVTVFKLAVNSRFHGRVAEGGVRVLHCKVCDWHVVLELLKMKMLEVASYLRITHSLKVLLECYLQWHVFTGSTPTCVKSSPPHPLLGSKTICFSNLYSSCRVTEGLDSVLTSSAIGHGNLSFEKQK